MYEYTTMRFRHSIVWILAKKGFTYYNNNLNYKINDVTYIHIYELCILYCYNALTYMRKFNILHCIN